jgi:hypothetical protein
MTKHDAEIARRVVHDKWGSRMPQEVKNYETENIFVFYQKPVLYRAAFDVMWNARFKSVLKRECTAAVVAQASTGRELAGFVTASPRIKARRIHINPESQEFDPIGALVHEYIHFLSHEEFYPRYYSEGGDNPWRVEGVTDWLTVCCFKDYFHQMPVKSIARAIEHQRKENVSLTPDDRAAYRMNFDKSKAWIDKDAKNEAKLLNFVFNGVRTDLSGIGR